jgi:hypothetical protein
MSNIAHWPGKEKVLTFRLHIQFRLQVTQINGNYIHQLKILKFIVSRATLHSGIAQCTHRGTKTTGSPWFLTLMANTFNSKSRGVLRKVKRGKGKIITLKNQQHPHNIDKGEPSQLDLIDD